jgi:chromosome segregation ATPase
VSCVILNDVECDTENFPHPKLINMSGVIDSEPKFKICFEKFTKHWYIAETLEDALKISKNEKRNIVTLKGEIFKSGGEIKSKRTNFSICIKTKLEDERFVSEKENHSNNNQHLVALKKELSELETQIAEHQARCQNTNEFHFKKIIHEKNKEKMILESKRDRSLKRCEQNESLIAELIERNHQITLNPQELIRFDILSEKMKQKSENEKKSIKFIQKNKLNIERMINEENFKSSKLSSTIKQNESSTISLSKEIKEIQSEIKDCKMEIKKLSSNHNPEHMKIITKKLNSFEEDLNELIQKVNQLQFKRR